MSLALATASVACAGPAHGATDGAQCERKYSDERVRQRLVEKKYAESDALVHVNWKDCTYYIVVWDQPVIPDAQRIYLMDVDGNIRLRSPL